MRINGLSALRCWPVAVELGGDPYRIAPRPAIDWMIPLLDESWMGIVPGLIDRADPLTSTLTSRLFDRTITSVECVRAARDATEVMAGMPWWTAVRLVLAATQNPDLSGQLVLDGVDATRVSLGAFTQATYRIMTRDADKKQRSKIDHSLEATPEGLRSEDRYDPEIAGNLFAQMARSRGIAV